MAIIFEERNNDQSRLQALGACILQTLEGTGGAWSNLRKFPKRGGRSVSLRLPADWKLSVAEYLASKLPKPLELDPEGVATNLPSAATQVRNRAIGGRHACSGGIVQHICTPSLLRAGAGCRRLPFLTYVVQQK